MASNKQNAHIDLNGNEIQNVVIQRLNSAPDADEGQIYYLNGDDSLYLEKAAGASKLLDAGDIQDDDSFSSPSATKVPSSESVKAYVDNRVLNLSEGTACRAVAVANVNLTNGLENGDTIDGVTLATGDRVLLTAQSDATQNGIYVVVASGTASRSAETGAQLANRDFRIQEGTTYHDTRWSITNDSITLGSTSITVVQASSNSAPDASTTVKGIVELATQAEAQAKSSSSLAVTPASLADFTRKYTADFSSSTGATIAAATHGLGATKALQVFVYEDGSPNTLVAVEISVADNGDVTWASNQSISGHIVIIG